VGVPLEGHGYRNGMFWVPANGFLLSCRVFQQSAAGAGGQLRTRHRVDAVVTRRSGRSAAAAQASRAESQADSHHSQLNES
jgi:hypothetical protein